MIQPSVRTHDRHQFELKLADTLDDVETPKAYDHSLFFFLPPSLRVAPDTYTKRDFFGDLVTYLRLKTPPVLLRDLATNPQGQLETV